MLKELEEKAVIINNIRFISGKIQTDSAEILKNIAYQIRNHLKIQYLSSDLKMEDKANLLVMVSDKLVKEKNLNAVAIIKEISGEINGGGGGQPFLATAGGKNPAGNPESYHKSSNTSSENLNN